MECWALLDECEALCVQHRAPVVENEAFSVECRALLVEFCRGQFWMCCRFGWVFSFARIE